MSFASQLNRSRLSKINTLEHALQKLELEQQRDGFAEDRKKEIDLVRVNLNKLLKNRAEFQIHRVRKNYYFHGSRPSRLLALSLQLLAQCRGYLLRLKK